MFPPCNEYFFCKNAFVITRAAFADMNLVSECGRTFWIFCQVFCEKKTKNLVRPFKGI